MNAVSYEDRSVEAAVIQLVSDLFEILPLERLDLDTRLDEDLEMDTQDFAELMIALEEYFDLDEIHDDTSDGWKTVGDVVKFLDKAR